MTAVPQGHPSGGAGAAQHNNAPRHGPQEVAEVVQGVPVVVPLVQHVLQPRQPQAPQRPRRGRPQAPGGRRAHLLAGPQGVPLAADPVPPRRPGRHDQVEGRAPVGARERAAGGAGEAAAVAGEQDAAAVREGRAVGLRGQEGGLGNRVHLQFTRDLRGRDRGAVAQQRGDDGTGGRGAHEHARARGTDEAQGRGLARDEDAGGGDRRGPGDQELDRVEAWPRKEECRRPGGGGGCGKGVSNPIAKNGGKNGGKLREIAENCGAVTKPPAASRRNTSAHRAPTSTRGGQAKSNCGKTAGKLRNWGKLRKIADLHPPPCRQFLFLCAAGRVGHTITDPNGMGFLGGGGSRGGGGGMGPPPPQRRWC